ncbi:MAG TPA: rhodanese-like domain-containing protein [Anaerolineae bacterium]|nr:rhodanese-like domain-containing protein [Anaerolineae bacterium]
MLLKYFYNEKLAHASYLVGCQQTGEAIVVDPGRRVTPYLKAARKAGVRIIAVVETHIHADFVSGARQLAAQVRAKLYLSDEGGAEWQYGYVGDYAHELVGEGDSFMIGNLKFDVLHVPGHTPEHIALLLTDTAAADLPMGIFTGDFLFAGSVGRPDLLEKVVGQARTAVLGAQQMYRSLQRVRHLPDYLQVWPAHGAGSACGKGLGAIPSTTLGYEKLFNQAFTLLNEEAFVEWLLADQPAPPHYFADMKRINRVGPKVVGERPLPLACRLADLKEKLGEVTIVDTRSPGQFARAHLPGSINIPYGDSFLNWAGWLIKGDESYYLVTDEAGLEEIVAELWSIGLEGLAGYWPLEVIADWERGGKVAESYELVTATELSAQLKAGMVTVLDVRNADEWQTGTIPGAVTVHLGMLPEKLDEIPLDKPIVVHCETGFRSAIGVSVLQAAGVKEVANLQGGIVGWRSAGMGVAA